MKLKKVTRDISKYKNIYVMSDIHGHYKEFLDMLKLINFSDEDLLIVIGDTIDRGDSNLDVLQYCMSNNNIILLMGNHEYMMTSIIKGDRGEFDNWTCYNGGDKTVAELEEIMSNDKDKCKEILAKVNSLPHYMEIDINNQKYLLIHAGITGTGLFDNIDDIMSMQSFMALWVRKEFLKSKIKKPFTIIFGHTPTYIIDYEINNSYPFYYYKKVYDEEKVKEEAKNSKIWYGEGKIGIDCGLYKGGKLACLRLNDMKEFYVDKINN